MKIFLSFLKDCAIVYGIIIGIVGWLILYGFDPIFATGIIICGICVEHRINFGDWKILSFKHLKEL